MTSSESESELPSNPRRRISTTSTQPVDAQNEIHVVVYTPRKVRQSTILVISFYEYHLIYISFSEKVPIGELRCQLSKWPQVLRKNSIL